MRGNPPTLPDAVGLAPSTIYGLIKRSLFPPGIRLTGARAVGWRKETIDEWLAERAAASGSAA